MEVKIGDIVIGDAVIHDSDAKVLFDDAFEEEYFEEEYIPEKVWETKEIKVNLIILLPFMPPHPYNIVLFYWYLRRNSVLIQDSGGECWELY